MRCKASFAQRALPYGGRHRYPVACALGLSLFILSMSFSLQAQNTAADSNGTPTETVVAATADSYKEQSVQIHEKEREILATLYSMTKQQRQLAQLKSDQLQKREELESDVTDLQSNIQEVSEQIKVMRKKIATRTRNLHKINAPTIFQTIFGSQNLSEMDRNSRILYRLSKSEVDQLRDFRGLKNLLDQQRQELEIKLQALEKTQQSLDSKEEEIKKIYFTQTEMLKKLESEDKKILKTLKKLKAKTANTALAMYAPALEQGLFEKKGQLELPVAGVVTQKFGLLPLRQEKLKIYNKGWFISCASGKEVYPVHSGTIAFVGILEERQHVVIVDHGDHFYSVYGNLSGLNVAMGDAVTAMNVLGHSGGSRLFGQGLYLEIRHFSQSEDPSEWFDENRLRISSLKESSI